MNPQVPSVRRMSVCLVAGGEPVADRLWASALAERGWRVRLLQCEPRRDGAEGRALGASGVLVSRLEEIAVPAACRAANGTPGCGPEIYASNLIRYAVETLHRAERFDAIVFPGRGAAGFRSVQAKRAGTAFRDVSLVARLDGFGRWRREAEKRWPVVGDLFLDYCERYAFENADRQIASSEYLLHESRRLGWSVRADACAPNILGEGKAPQEIVFIVSSDAPAWLELACDAARRLDVNVPVAFLLPAALRAEVRRMSERVTSRMAGRTHTLRCGFDRRRRLEYLAGGGRLAVVCDGPDVLSATAHDCIASGVPFLAARPRWLPGCVGENASAGPWFFKATGPDAAGRLRDLIRDWRPASPAIDLAASPPAGCAEPAGLARQGTPAATLAVTYYNLGRYLPETLASLATQTRPDLEVLVVDDGSTCEESRRVWEEQRRLHPQFRFIRQPNAGLGVARNRALREARGEFFIPVDADNVAVPGMADSFIRALRADPDAAAMTCFFLAFKDTDDIAKGQFAYQYCPTGGPHVAACACNVYGDANAVFRTAVLREAGGFVEDRSTYCHDWETFVKLARAGRRVGVVPEYLFYYRLRPDGMSASMTRAGTDLYPFVQRMLAAFRVADEPAEARLLREALAGALLQDVKDAQPRRRGFGLRRLARRVARLFPRRPGVTP